AVSLVARVAESGRSASPDSESRATSDAAPATRPSRRWRSGLGSSLPVSSITKEVASGNGPGKGEAMSSEGSAPGHPGKAPHRIGTRHAIYAVGILFGINTMNFYDRQVVGAIGELVREEWGLNDKQ